MSSYIFDICRIELLMNTIQSNAAHYMIIIIFMCSFII